MNISDVWRHLRPSEGELRQTFREIDTEAHPDLTSCGGSGPVIERNEVFIVLDHNRHSGPERLSVLTRHGVMSCHKHFIFNSSKVLVFEEDEHG